MMRTILKSTKSSLTLELPDDLIGKTIEVIAFSVDDEKSAIKDTTSKELKSETFKSKLNSLAINSGGYKFNRDDANDYE